MLILYVCISSGVLAEDVQGVGGPAQDTAPVPVLGAPAPHPGHPGPDGEGAAQAAVGHPAPPPLTPGAASRCLTPG